MASRTPSRPTRAEQRFWDAAFLAAEFPSVLKNGKRIGPAGAAHIAAEYATAALAERRRFRTTRGVL